MFEKSRRNFEKLKLLKYRRISCVSFCFFILTCLSFKFYKVLFLWSRTINLAFGLKISRKADFIKQLTWTFSKVKSQDKNWQSGSSLSKTGLCNSSYKSRKNSKWKYSIAGQYPVAFLTKTGRPDKSYFSINNSWVILSIEIMSIFETLWHISQSIKGRHWSICPDFVLFIMQFFSKLYSYPWTNVSTFYIQLKWTILPKLFYIE